MTSFAKKPYILVIFKGEGVQTPVPPLDPPMTSEEMVTLMILSSNASIFICSLHAG